MFKIENCSNSKTVQIKKFISRNYLNLKSKFCKFLIIKIIFENKNVQNKKCSNFENVHVKMFIFENVHFEKNI